MKGEKSEVYEEAIFALYFHLCVIALRLRICIFQTLLGEMQRKGGVLHEIPSVASLLLKTVSITVIKEKITDSSQVKMNVDFQFFCLSLVGMK